MALTAQNSINHACRANLGGVGSFMKKPDGSYKLHHGDEGKIMQVAYNESQKQENVAVWIRRLNRADWFPVAFFHANFEISPKVCGDMTVRFMFPQPSGALASLKDSTESKFLRAARALLRQWVTQRDFLHEIADWVWDLLGENGERIDTVIQNLGSAINHHGARTEALLSNDNLDWQGITALPSVDNVRYTGKGGIYIILYDQFADKSNKLVAYIGSTYSFKDRAKQHENCAKSTKSQNESGHYRVAGQAGRRRFRVLAWHDDLSLKGRDSFRWRLLYEQIFFALFGAYRPSIISLQSPWKDEHINFIQSPFQDDVIFGRFPAAFSMDEWVAAFHRVAEQANAISSWAAILGRSSFKRQFSTAEGLNRQSPLSPISSEIYEPSIWFRTQMRHAELGLVYNFTKQKLGTMYAENSTVKNLWRLYIGRTKNKSVTVNFYDVPGGPKPGDQVRLTFELRVDGGHPRPVMGLPKLGCFRDWDLANSVGLKATWTDQKTKQRRESYVTRTKVWEVRQILQDSMGGQYAGYAHGRALRRYLLQQPVVDGSNHLRQCDVNVGTASIRRVDIDFYNQRATVHPPQPPSQDPIPDSIRKEPQELVDDMTEAGLTNAGKNKNNIQGWSLSGRPNCDACDVRIGMSGDKEHCDTHEEMKDRLGNKTGIWTCSQCKKRGMPCSWTIYELTANAMKHRKPAEKVYPPAEYPKLAIITRALIGLRRDDQLWVSRETGKTASQIANADEILNEAVEVDTAEPMTEAAERKVMVKKEEDWDARLE
jgi:ribosomal protein L37AE/L43A